MQRRFIHAQLLYNSYNHMWTTENKQQQQQKKLCFFQEMKEGRREGRDGEEVHCEHKPETVRAAREKA